MREVMSKNIVLKGNASYLPIDLANYIAAEINKQCPDGYCFKQIVESLSDIKEIKRRGNCNLFTASQIVVIYQRIK